MITQGNFMRRSAAFGWATAAILAAGPTVAQNLDGAAGAAVLASPPPVLAFAEHTRSVAPVTAEAKALRLALGAKLGRNSSAIGAYGMRGYQPIWLDENGRATDAARALVNVLKQAGAHALPVAKYNGDALAARLGETGIQLEVALTAAFLTYARDVSSGLLDPRSVDRELVLEPMRPDEGLLIERAGKAPNMTAFLDGLAPTDPAYRRVLERYAAFRSIAGEDIWGPRISKGRTIRPGNRNDRVAQARARLTAMGDLDPNVYQLSQVADGTQIAANTVVGDAPNFEARLFDKPMKDALKRFQRRHGLNLDGVIGPATLRQMNMSARDRAEQMAVTLERMRWLNNQMGEHYIFVNLASFDMQVINRGAVEFESRVVVGKAKEHRTPEFSDTMKFMVINPSWYIPASIAKKKILPRMKGNPGYLAARNMYRLKNGTIVQKPGRGNALGTVKFMFPNRWAIYLHDTPSKRLFRRDVRAYSHGCVRVEHPHDFAAYLLTGQVDNPKAYFNRILRRGKERHVDIKRKLPIHLTYRTAWVDENGIEQFRNDIYGRDRRIARSLQKAGVTVLQ